ncbi:MAG: hypothetical protein NZ483_04340 [Verrucomicrobiae bacterium]|nr:hypothetical protein [Verrucomicrobiae bacterium]MDW8345175.1 hypothetical protein [Verrucomicrobiae bacterium]
MNTVRWWMVGISVLVWGWMPVAQATVVNPSFESPEIPEDAPVESTPTGWTFFSPGFDTSGVIENAGIAQTGDQVLQFFAPGGGVDIGRQGYYQTLPLVLAAWQPIAWQVYLRNSSVLPMKPGVVAVLGIEFLRSDLTEINRAELFVQPSQLSTAQWLPFVVAGHPTNEPTAFVRFVIAQDKLSSTSDSGIFWAEDAAIIPEPGIFLLAVLGAGVVMWRRRTRSCPKQSLC